MEQQHLSIGEQCTRFNDLGCVTNGWGRRCIVLIFDSVAVHGGDLRRALQLKDQRRKAELAGELGTLYREGNPSRHLSSPIYASQTVSNRGIQTI
jgi:hypothetical protein